MHINDVDIPAEYEFIVMRIATLLSQYQGNDRVMEEAAETLQTLLERLTPDTPFLFKAALLRNLAEVLQKLWTNRAAPKQAQIVAYFNQAVALYLAAGSLLDAVNTLFSLSDWLIEQGSHEDTLESLQAAIQLLRSNEQCNSGVHVGTLWECPR